MSKEYVPKPVDTKSVLLEECLVDLTELLAKNAHENWAKQRMKDGWTFGNKRDDEQKKHPCLIPYEELPDSEKEYDRVTAMESLKAIIKLGFSIIKS